MKQFKPDNPHEVLRLYQGGASVSGLAKACSVSELTMERFLSGQGVYKRPQTISKTRSNKGTPQRPVHISGQELSDAWWESNNQAFCDAMDRGYPEMKFSDQ
jgi:hypothetical protein